MSLELPHHGHESRQRPGEPGGVVTPPRRRSSPAGPALTIEVERSEPEKADGGLEAVVGALSDLSAAEQVELLVDDQCRRWQDGKGVPVERYLQLLPALADHAVHLLDLVFNEVLLREEVGEAPRLEEYVRRFPELAEPLERQFCVHDAFRADVLAPNGPCDQLEPQATVTPARAGNLETPVDKLAATQLVPGPGPANAFDAFLPTGYRLLEEVGHGSMGVVYKAEQLGLGRIVALKMIVEGAHAGPQRLARFRAEAEIIAGLRHPNIVQIYEVGNHNGCPFLCLEYVEGGSLDRTLGGLPQQPLAAARHIQVLANAVQAAHEQGIVHRDLKPHNVLVAADGTLKITDFGLARRLDDDSGGTQSGIVLGTPSYMAPEQARGETRRVGPFIDIYALGAIFYECLTGRPPFQAATQIELLEQVRDKEPVPPSQLQPRVPRDLETICLKCLLKEPDRRYLSAAALAQDLERFLSGRPIQARPVPWWERGLKWVRRKPTAAALLAVSLLAGLSAVAGGFLILEQRARTAERRASAAVLIREGLAAKEARNWQSARVKVAEALAKLGDEPSLAGLRGEAEQLREAVDECLQAVQRLERFRQLRDDALFHGTLNTGEGLEANRIATRTAVQQALELFGAGPGKPQVFVPGLSLNETENLEVREGCYEMLLVLSAVEVHAAADQRKQRLLEALRLLDHAAGLGYAAHPTHAWNLRQARYQEQLGNPAAAQQARARAAEHAPATALDYFLLGDEHYKHDRVLEAMREFERALGLQPNHFWARYFLSVCYLRVNRPREALAGLTACLGQRPGMVWLYLLRGSARGQLKQFEDALADFREAETSPALTRDAAHVLYANRGALWHARGDPGAAIADLRRAIAAKPHDYQARVTLAQICREREDWNGALAQLDLAIECEPELPFLYRLRSRLHFDRPEPDLKKALGDIDLAVRHEGPAGPSAVLAQDHVERGRILHRLRRYPEALAAFETAQRACPDLAVLYLRRAETQRALADHDGVEQSLGEYLRCGGPPATEVYHVRGLARTQRQRYADALEDFTRALAIQEDHLPSLVARGWAYLATQAWQLAERDFRAALVVDPASGDVHSGRGYALVKLGRYPEAVAEAETALRIGTPGPRLWYNAARIFAQAVDRFDAGPPAENNRARAERARWQDSAVELLGKALGAQPLAEQSAFWQNQVQKDSAFVPIRGVRGFEQLWRRYSPTAP